MKIYSSSADETEHVGLSDNDIDGFLKTIMKSVCRETAQNSNDESLTRPVRMNFELQHIPISQIPDHDKFRNIIEKCLEEAKNTEDTRAIEFFTTATDILSKDEISVLTISDEGTNGAGGDFKKLGKFFTLTVSKGVTNKTDLHSAGSFGIGKMACFAASQLRTVFYSSTYDDEENFYCLGKSVLTSWTNDSCGNMRNQIFFSANDKKLFPIEDLSAVPQWLKKDSRGLKISILAPRSELREGWTNSYIAAFVSNFFLAIHDGTLEFSMNKASVRINKSTLLNFFDDPSVREAAINLGDEDKFNWAYECTLALTSNTFISEYIHVPNIGDLEILIRVNEGLPKKTCFIRNGMFITDNLALFGKRLQRFNNTKDFIVIVRPKNTGNQASQNLKRLENPEHNEFSTGYLSDEKEQKIFNDAMGKVEAEIRSVIKKHAQMEVKETKDIEELKQFFKSPKNDNEIDEGTGELDPIIISNKEIIENKSSQSNHQKSGKGTGGNKEHGNKRKTKTKKRRPGPGNKQSGNYKEFEGKCRAVKTSGGNKWLISLSDLPPKGLFLIAPEEESRSGDSRPIHINSCNIQDAKISSNKSNMEFLLDGSIERTFTIEVNEEVNIINIRPIVREV